MAGDIACDLSSDDRGVRAERWSRLWRAAGRERTATPDGVQMCFDDGPAVEDELRALAAGESTCCSWARWHVRRADDGLILTVSSTSEGAAVLHGMFGACNG